ncbi:MAG TPA: futalosine hydrolase [Micromonosporaceae bacterium]
MSGARLLVVTAVAAERQAVERGLPSSHSVTVIDGGVGMASAAAATAAALCGEDRYTAVICAGIGGGFAVAVGGLALATASVAADLGTESPEGFLGLEELGLGRSTVECDADLVSSLAAQLPEAVRGAVLTVATVTGTREREQILRERHPDAVAEAMEGFGVATAVTRAGLPFAELRAVSNLVGPRNRPAWRIVDALVALERAGAALATLVP